MSGTVNSSVMKDFENRAISHIVSDGLPSERVIMISVPVYFESLLNSAAKYRKNYWWEAPLTFRTEVINFFLTYPEYRPAFEDPDQVMDLFHTFMIYAIQRENIRLLGTDNATKVALHSVPKS